MSTNRARRPRFAAAAALTLLVAVLGLPPADAATEATPAPERRWYRVETGHFTFFGDVGQEALTAIAVDLERMRQALLQIAPSGRFESHVPIRLYLFEEEEALVPFLPGGTRRNTLALSSPAVLVPHEHGVYGASLRVEEEARGERYEQAGRYVYKQYLHWILGTNLPELPMWFRQGLAELYSNFDVTDTEARIGLPIEAHIRYLRPRMAPASDAAVPPTPGKPQGATGLFDLLAPAPGAHYPKLWALVHYLVIGSDETRAEVPGYLRRLVAGDEPEAAFRAAFGRDREQILAELPVYVAEESWRFARYPLNTLGPVAAQAEPLSPAETEYRLGDLLIHLRPEAVSAARRHFRRTLELDPGHGLAAAGLGWVAQLEGRHGEALDAFRRAAAAVPGDPLVQYLYGDALLTTLHRRRPTTDEDLATLRAAAAALSRATELAPALPEPWARLGLALNLEPKGSAEAVAALERAAHLQPSRMDVATNLLLAYARTGDVEAADRLLAALPARGADPETLAQAREIRLQLAFAEANALSRAGELDDAVAVLARIRAETRSPTTAERAAAQLGLVATAAAHNRFAASFQRASDLIAADDPEAPEALAELGEIVRPGRQTEFYEALVERLESRPSQADSSDEPKAAATPR